MAGNYVDAPNNRLAWHEDGTVMYTSDGASYTNVESQGNMNIANSEASFWLQAYGDYYAGLYFPALMDITGITVASEYVTGPYWYWSANTTNGLDGTWTSFTGPSNVGIDNKVQFRQNIGSVSLTGVRSIRYYWARNGVWAKQGTYHVYGRPTAAQTLNRVELWHPTLDQRLPAAYFDWGNVPRSSTADKQFRVKNISSTKIANNVVLQFGALTDASPTVPAQHFVSADGVNFAGTQTIASIAAGAISPVYTMRRVTPSGAALSLWWLRLRAVPTSWT